MQSLFDLLYFVLKLVPYLLCLQRGLIRFHSAFLCRLSLDMWMVPTIFIPQSPSQSERCKAPEVDIEASFMSLIPGVKTH
jgi:hypothetical protein